MYTHKIEGVIGETHYILAPTMRGMIPEAAPVHAGTVVYRDGTPRLWPIKFPRDGERDNGAWISARSCARIAMEKWVKLVWSGGVLHDPRCAAGLRAGAGLLQAAAVR